jgi:hypothetical protein
MIPTQQQGYPIAGAGYSTTFNTQGFPTGQNFLQQTTSQEHSLHQGADPNSPALFKQNLQLVQQSVLRLQDDAKRALDGMYISFSPCNINVPTSLQSECVPPRTHADAD